MRISTTFPTYFIANCIVLSLTTSAHSGDDQPFTITPLVLEGDYVTDDRTVIAINKVAINNFGEWIVEARTDGFFDCIDVLLRGGKMILNECGTLDEPEGATIFNFGSVNINNSGNSVLEIDFLANDSFQGIYVNTDLLLKDGDISTAEDFIPGTTYKSFFGIKVNNNNPPQILVNTEVEVADNYELDALVIITPMADGHGITETVVAKTGDILPGQTEPIISIINYYSGLYAMNDAGDVMFGALLENPDWFYVVYINGMLVAEDEGPSPIKGRNWNRLGVRANVDINNRGDYVLQGGIDGDSASNVLIARNGKKLVQEGDVLPGTNGAPIRPAFFLPVLINDLGQVLWQGLWDNPDDDSVLKGLLLDLNFLIREGVPTQEGFVFKSIAPGIFSQIYAMSDNGRYIIFQAILQDGTDGAFLIDFGAPCPWDLDDNGFVGTSDLLELFTQWGTDGSADFDDNGYVGTSDLLILFANWGPCE